MLENNLKALIKIQYVDSVAKSKAAQGIVGKRLAAVDKRGILPFAKESLDLDSIMDREIQQLSGGELQRFVIAMTCI
jgi:ATP-binding cassette subfamily E protein 1